MNNYKKQVSKDLYFSDRYMTPRRWSTYSEIISFVLKHKPRKILEIGPGNKIVKDILEKLNFNIKTLDFDKDINPDYTLDITSCDIRELKKEKFDLIIASEVLEHIEYKDFKKVLLNLKYITTGKLLLTLPYTCEGSKTFYLRICRKLEFSKKLFLTHRKHIFNGQHYWEIGKKNHELHQIRKDIISTKWKISHEYINKDNYYHYFLILK